ncbi:glycosyl transferase [Devosia epidermidihirudinis]|uniref:Glycosyl transferase n=1 Tax=Devosia epidermidihirudinis TaxID=1293439 RepID=A0A0F5Q4L0_9HYPH|nr:glucoamylase family protein [Devosia epidermidihirudinis]KKC35810.1 glycosyl transferase [Devosia epidermidihirudinis]
MISILRHTWGHRRSSMVWSDRAPVREELFGVERLEQHAESLAAAQQVTAVPIRVMSLHTRLNDNASVLLAAYRASAAELEGGQYVVPAAEWVLDNYHLIEEQIREIRDDLPPGYYRQLPKLAEGPFAGYPRVLGLAWAYVAHTDSHFDPETLVRFIAAYQRVQPLTIGELWAVAITLRIVLIENLRRLADQISSGRVKRADADELANQLLVSGNARSALDNDIALRAAGPLSEVFAAQLAKRLRDRDPRTTPALGWLEERLAAQGTSVETVVQHAQQRQGASNVSVRNVITSMRVISDIDWADLFEQVSLVDARLRAHSAFGEMDFATRNLYRSAIEQLARGSDFTELEVADKALEAAEQIGDERDAERMADPGYYLIAEGRAELERVLDFRAPPRLRFSRFNSRLGIGGYIGFILALTVLLLALAVWALTATGGTAGWLLAFAIIALLPMTEVATALINRGVAWSFGATTLPALELTSGVPPSLRTLIAVPTLLTTEADLIEQIEQLEVHHLAGASGDLVFALLLDGVDADEETLEGDAELLATAAAAIARLNERYGPGPAGDRFLVLHRKRLFNGSENKWMGWERKRGKLHELNRLLRGATDTSFVPITGAAPHVPVDVRYVITLDADTRLPREAALRLIGKMAHPLNHPRFDAADKQVIKGHGILQPRVTPSLPQGNDGSLYQRAYSGPGGMDPYAAAVSDVYQDLFGEGSFTGKGIYDVDAFEKALAGRVPENTLLSHDLFEGIFARSGLASDVELVEGAPSRYDVAVKRQHRWTRGDWQLLPWLFKRQDGVLTVSAVGRGKMLDNLRRSLLAPLALLAMGLSWLLPERPNLLGVFIVIGVIALPAFLPSLLSVFHRRTGVLLTNHFKSVAADLRIAAVQTFLTTTFLPDQAWRMGDAIVRTLVRLFVTHRNLLEWTTAAQSMGSPRLGLFGFYRSMAAGTLLGLAICAGALAMAPAAWTLILPFAVLWILAPVVALLASQPQALPERLALSDTDADALRLIARRTWRFFETFVTANDHMLPPDNFQENPRPVVAHRTSPTNIGLYMLSAVAARDFGWAGTSETIERLEATFASIRRLTKFRGHLVNWYDTQDLRALDPIYVSSVDSGNLAGHLIALANACEEWSAAPLAFDHRPALADTLHLARIALMGLPSAEGPAASPLTTAFDEMEAELTATRTIQAATPSLRRMAEKVAKAAHDLVPLVGQDSSLDLIFWCEALRRTAFEHERDLSQAGAPAAELSERLQALADTARQMALDMDFAWLLDPERKLLSIGYSLVDNRLDPSCYDLLASEARLASLFAVAKGDVPTQHWFRLGRAATPLGNGSALISWSGSMFEYLMPSLVMREPIGSLLEETSRLVVERQQDYGRSLGVPWGISESAYNARDMELTYQYSNFGVPGLGLKRGLSDNVVIAPYATGLATMVDPPGALRNYGRLATLGGSGRYGFFEALDFTRSRVPEDKDVAVVRNFMAHHQGMTIVAIANTLRDGQMRERFHREPMIRASELLLQERVPRDIVTTHPRAEEVKASPAEAIGEAPAVRRIHAPSGGQPITHLLSNGRYAVMLTAAGSGYSRWRDIAITRWREDATRDDWGSYIIVRDTQNGNVWSAGTQPIKNDADHDEVIFGEDHVEFTRRYGSLTTTTDVLVSGEDDGEVRRVTLTNTGRRPREIELTSYAEVVLTTPATDNAHPAFAKMFVQTEHLPEFDAIIATRRPRSASDPQVWAAHFAVVEGELAADPQYETDRAKFIGNARALGDAAVLRLGRPLSNTVGTVLDPIFSLRRRLKVSPGKVSRVAFWTIVAASRAELLDLLDKHHDRSAFERAKTLAWTQAQVELRHLDVDAQEAADFQRLAAPILYADKRFRPSSEIIGKGAGPQSGLWPMSISGDLPIVLLRIEDVEDIAQVRQLLRAQEYWRMKRLGVDLVIINERGSSYVQDLQIAIETAVRSSQLRPNFGEPLGKGAVYTLRADLMSVEARALLRSVARVVLNAHNGSISHQLDLMPIVAAPPLLARAHRINDPVILTTPALEFFNGLGGFDADGTEYVTVLNAGQSTPAPWINVIANPDFGFQVSAEGSGYSWAANSRENQLTQWSNDPVTDPTGEAFYIRDEDTADLWSPTAQPIRDGGTYIARHGFGYSRFEHSANGIASTLLQYVPLGDPIKISRLTLTNLSGKPRRLSVTSYAEWVLGTARGASAPFIATEMDTTSGAVFAHNPWSPAFSDRIAFSDLGGHHTGWTADRTEFIGRHGSLAAPAALLGRTRLSASSGTGLDPCAALQRVVELGIGETIEIVSFIGQSGSPEAVRDLITRYRSADLDQVLADVTNHWSGLLGAIQVKTPDRAMDIMLNGWLLYQTLACRVWARSAFYQASGAYGFRDQLQDGMALTFAIPEETRRHLLRAAARQFPEGDVQHWWLPQSGQGVRTRISDDRVWLAFATATYIAASGDAAILDETVPFLEGPRLLPEEHDAFFQPMLADESASLFEHCAGGLDQCLELTGKHGLPLMGTGDWNDGMSRVGEGGKGESVWLAWLLIRTITLFLPLAEARAPERAKRWRAHMGRVRAAIERHAWDGEWYRRATFDDGTWLGSRLSEECQIDSIAQSWAVLSGVADPARAATAMASLQSHLVRPHEGLALLFTPPFDKTPHDPGYIKGYPPGLRENGGQYSHAAMWAIMAFAKLGQGDKSHHLFGLLNPINHAHTPEQVNRYKVEPYVIAADVYSVAPHVGRGGWTWYTGSAGWMHRAGLEAILGITREGNNLIIAPCLPSTWPGFEATVNLSGTQYDFRVINTAADAGTQIERVIVDGTERHPMPSPLRFPLDGGSHRVEIHYGK